MTVDEKLAARGREAAEQQLRRVKSTRGNPYPELVGSMSALLAAFLNDAATDFDRAYAETLLDGMNETLRARPDGEAITHNPANR